MRHVNARFSSVCLLALAWGSTTFGAPPSKPPKDPEPDPGVVTPVEYAVRTVPVVGLNYSFDSNDYGLALCNIATGQVSPPLATPASQTVAVVDIHSGQVTYIDPLLTEPTIWTKLPEGVYDVSVNAMKINNFGTILVQAVPYIDGVGSREDLSRTYLLKPVHVETPEGGTELRYQPTDLGIVIALFLNDLDWIVGYDLTGWLIRTADGSKTYLKGIGLAERHGDLYDLTNSGFVNGGLESTNFPLGRNYIYDVFTEEVTYYEGVGCKDWPGRSMNDHGVIAGRRRVTFQYKDRGKTVTGYRDVPAILDPTTGLQVFDVSGNNSVVNAIVYINHQRKNGESTILSYYPKDAQRDLWLKLPGAAGFHLYDAMNEAEKQEWTAIGYGDRINGWEGPTEFVRILTPRNEDYSVDDNMAPTITGVIWSGGPGYPGLWVCEPVVANP